MLLCGKADTKASEMWSFPGVANLSYGQFETLSGLSRPMLYPALSRLRELGLIQCLPHPELRNRQVYLVNGFDLSPGVGGWAKFPSRYLGIVTGAKSSKLMTFPIRGRIPALSLKIYLLLLAFRPNESNGTKLSFDKIEYYSNVPRREIRRAISLLASEGWVDVNKHPGGEDGTNPPNEYFIKGFSS
jgi:hypothetical protein